MVTPLDAKVLKHHVKRIVHAGDLSTLTSKQVRKELEGIFDMPLKEHKEQIEVCILRVLDRVRASEVEQEAAEQQRVKEGEDSKIQQEKESKGKEVPKTVREPSLEESRLRKLIAACGLQAKTRFRGVGSFSEEVLLEKLKGVLIDAVGTDRPSKERIAEYKAARALAQELDGIDSSNIIGGASGAGTSSDGRGDGDNARGRRPVRVAAAKENFLVPYNVDKEAEDLLEDEFDFDRAAPAPQHRKPKTKAVAPSPSEAPAPELVPVAKKRKRIIDEDEDEDEDEAPRGDV